MRIVLEPEVTTSRKSFFAFPYYTFNGQQSPTKYFKIPLLQRDYVWPEEKEESVKELLSDLYHHVKGLPNVPPIPQDPANNSVFYYTGTILCESQQSLAPNSDTLSLVDGQQRVTTLYLINYVGYLLSRFALDNLPVGLPPRKYFTELSSRFSMLVKWENRCFIKSNITDELNDYFNDDDSATVNELTQKFEVRIGLQKRKALLQTKLWPFLEPRLKFADDEITTYLKDALIKTDLKSLNGSILFSAKASLLKDNPYALGLSIIMQHLNEVVDTSLEIDDKVKEMLCHLEAYISHLAMTCIISENENDSFFLFEVLNDRGQDLTALDLVKNMILERSISSGPIADFESRWKQVKKNVSNLGSRGKADSNFIKNLIRSECSTASNKQIAYLRNRYTILRKDIFRVEENADFFLRMAKAAEILSELQNNSKSETAFDSYKASCFQYSTYMRMIGYDWGQQVMIGSNLLYLMASHYSHPPNGQSKSLHEKNNWTSTQRNPSTPDLKHFSQFLADILLKIGIVGIINKQSEGLLPECSQKILDTIIEFARLNKDKSSDPSLLRNLINTIRPITEDILNDQQRDEFVSRLVNEFYANTATKRNIAKIILFLVYSRGSILAFSNPELEHFEPENPPDPDNILPPYYNEGDRLLTINRLGNFFLIDRKINREFKNLSIIQKLKKAKDEYPSNPVFLTSLFRNVDFLHENPPVVIDPIHGNLPLISKTAGTPKPTDSFKEDFTPTKYFFNCRTELIAQLAGKYIFENNKFLSDGSSYI